MKIRPLTVAVGAAGIYLLYLSGWSPVLVVLGVALPLALSLTRLGETSLMFSVTASIYVVVLGQAEPFHVMLALAGVLAVFLVEPLIEGLTPAHPFYDYMVPAASAVLAVLAFLYSSMLLAYWSSSAVEGSRYLGLVYRSPEGITITYLAVLSMATYLVGKALGPGVRVQPSQVWLLPARLSRALARLLVGRQTLERWLYLCLLVLGVSHGMGGVASLAAGLLAGHAAARRFPTLRLPVAAAAVLTFLWLSGQGADLVGVAESINAAARGFDRFLESFLP